MTHFTQSQLIETLFSPLKAFWKQCASNSKLLESLVDIKNKRIDELLSQKEAMMAQLTAEWKKTREVTSEAGLLKENIDKAFNVDVEKRVHEATSDLRVQLGAAAGEAALYKKSRAEQGEMLSKVASLEDEVPRFSLCKADSEARRKAAEDEVQIIRQGYNQIRKSNGELETGILELQVDIEQVTKERNDLQKQVASIDDTHNSNNSVEYPSENRQSQVEPTTRLESIDKFTRELQHLDGTIAVWENMLTDATAQRDRTLEKKENVDAQIRQTELDLKNLAQIKTQAIVKPLVTATNVISLASTNLRAFANAAAPPTVRVVAPTGRQGQANDNGRGKTGSSDLRGQVPNDGWSKQGNQKKKKMRKD
ncbi:hypothetical protein EK21DRAFT_114822 [Setomelanomma holmii]|uniref:Uncharacterized protein n=1 Tax=Setomelanomma holmii TaxID=210430 RepID=A0A9P4LKY1_9PLEO|nr:hypothetical protein EK21DRAFT_114822 [Setomelanomma holmii]